MQVIFLSSRIDWDIVYVSDVTDDLFLQEKSLAKTVPGDL